MLLGAALVVAGASLALVGVVGVPLASAGEAWSSPVPIDVSNLLNSVSCTSATFCAAVDYQGNALTYNGSSWALATADPGNELTAVSCTSPTFCAAVDDQQGNALTYNGTTWSSPTAVDAGNAPSSVSCTSPTFCAAVDDNGSALTYNGSGWSSPASVDPGNELASVSCTSPTFCAAVDDNGSALTYNGSGWSSPASVDPGNELASVSCTSPTFCAAVDDNGSALTYNGTSWSSPVSVDPGNDLLSVSCTSPTFCVAGDASGSTTIFRGTSWSAPAYVEDNPIASLSCASPTFCVGVDDAGFAVTYTGVDAATITDVAFSGTPAAPVITVAGSGFGTLASLGTPSSPGCGPQTGSDFGNKLWIQDFGGIWTAGQGNDCIGLQISSYTDNQVIFSFGSDYSSYAPLSSGDSFSVSLLGAVFSATVSYSHSTQISSCTPGTTGCSATVDAPSQVVEVTGVKTAGTSASITLVVAPEVLACRSFSYLAPVATLTDTGLKAGTDVLVTDTVQDLPSKKGVVICYQPVGTSPPPAGFLEKCHGSHFVGACYKSVTEVAGSVQVRLELPTGDPRFHIGGETPQVTRYSPASATPGKKLTIKGENLSEITAVTIGGVSAPITKTAPTSVSVTVPGGAKSGSVRVTSSAGVVVGPSITVSRTQTSLHSPRHGGDEYRRR